MSQNPYEAPETIPIDEKHEHASDFGLLRSASPVAWVAISLLISQSILSILSYIGINLRLGDLNLMGISGWFIVITVCMWTHKSMVNAWVSGEPSPTISARSAVCWYFIPLANFVMPYLAMKQIWENLFGTKYSKAILLSWWLCWLGMWFILALKLYHHNNYIFDHENPYYGLIVNGDTFFRIAAGVLLIIVILKVTDGHNRRIKEYRANNNGR